MVKILFRGTTPADIGRILIKLWDEGIKAKGEIKERNKGNKTAEAIYEISIKTEDKKEIAAEEIITEAKFISWRNKTER